MTHKIKSNLDFPFEFQIQLSTCHCNLKSTNLTYTNSVFYLLLQTNTDKHFLLSPISVKSTHHPSSYMIQNPRTHTSLLPLSQSTKPVHHHVLLDVPIHCKQPVNPSSFHVYYHYLAQSHLSQVGHYENLLLRPFTHIVPPIYLIILPIAANLNLKKSP